MWLFYISCAWVAGIFLGAKVALPAAGLLVGLVPFLLAFLCPRRRRMLVMVGICFVVFALGLFRCSFSSGGEPSLNFYNDTGRVIVAGVVSEEPQTSGNSSTLVLDAKQVTVAACEEKVTGKVLVWVSRYPSYHYGDELRISGEMETPPVFEGFDYREHLACREIYSVVYYPGVELLGQNEGFAPLGGLYSLREKLSDSLSSALPEPQCSLAQGILLGDRTNIPDSITGTFSRAGTMHLLAISGLHIGIIAGIFLSLGIFIFGKQRSFYIWFALLAVWLYVVLAGMRPPVVRGAIMGSLFLLAEYLGRQRSAIIALGFTAAVMVAIHPHILWEVSFQLSFLAMAGIIYFFPHFRSPKGRSVVSVVGGGGRLADVRNMVDDSFAVSLSAIIAVWPVIAYNFGVISLVGLPATFLSLLAVPCIIVAAALVAFSGLFLPLLSQVLGWVAWFFLGYLMLVSQCFDALPLSSLQIGSFSTRLVWGYYVVLAVVVGCLELKGRKGWSLVNLRSQGER